MAKRIEHVVTDGTGIYDAVIEGVAPMLMANNSVFIGPRGTKKKETDAEKAIRYTNEWRRLTYFDAERGVYVPADNVEAMLVESSRILKLGKVFTAAVIVTPHPVLTVGGKKIKTLEELEKNDWLDRRNVNLNPSAKKKVMGGRTRPRIPSNWRLEFQIQVLAPGVDSDNLQQILEHAGQFVGLCDWRPKYGRFSLVSIKRRGDLGMED